MAILKPIQSQVERLYENPILFDWLGNQSQAVGTIIHFDNNSILVVRHNKGI